MTHVVKDLNWFYNLQDTERSAWIKEPGLRIYVRRPWVNQDWDIHLANIEARIPNGGALTRLLDQLEPIHTIYIENVMTQRFLDHLINVRKYQLHNPRSHPYSVIRYKGPL